MSVQFGKCNFDGKPVDPEEFERARPLLAPYGPDGEGYLCRENFGVLYRAFHTTSESRREVQPHQCASGAVVTWDGRLDNREELIDQLGHEVSFASTDVEIVAAAYERWEMDSFAKLIGDWALSIWDPKTRSLLLAKDFVGTRHLYYARERDEVTWSSILDPLVLLAGRSFELEEEYIAGWLSFFPATHLTPYVGIHAVPPSSFVRINRHSLEVRSYWDFDPGKQIRYASDAQYEEHFRALLAKSVRRRLRCDSHVLAELSGGMDSSSIVCMADRIAATTPTQALIGTVSFYDDTEPNWNERPYFSQVEEARGRAGCHIDVSAQTTLLPEYEKNCFSATPKSVGLPREAALQFHDLLIGQQHRVLLSGTGGDEVLGGVPNPTPELATLLLDGDFGAFGKQLRAWALAKRRPLGSLAAQTIRAFLPVQWKAADNHTEPEEWLYRTFVKRNWRILRGYEKRISALGALPSFQDAMNTLDALRRQLACSPLSSELSCELRYPYLDRDLLDYVYAIPRQQLVRPGQRRSLMRRALRGIVPDEILDRRRKAFVVRRPMAVLSRDRASLVTLTSRMISGAMQIVDQDEFALAIGKALRGQQVSLVAMNRTIRIECWLRHLVDFDCMKLRASTDHVWVSQDEASSHPQIAAQARIARFTGAVRVGGSSSAS